MIPGPFSYHRPATVADAVKLLSTLGDEARPLAGGHSLVPMMKLRLASPEHLVDLHGIAGLKGIRRDGNAIVIGAMTTQHEVLASEDIAKSVPILHETALLIADPAGALSRHHRRQCRQWRSGQRPAGADDDPGRELPARRRVRRTRGRRTRSSTRGLFHRARARRTPDRGLDSRAAAGHGYAYEKLKRKVGDYATAAAAVVLTMAGGKVATCSIGLTNLSETPLLADDAAQAVIGTSLDPATLKKAAVAASRHHVAGRRCPRPGRIPQACRRHHGDACAASAPPAALVRGGHKWQKPISP